MSLAMRWPWISVGEQPADYLDDVYRYAKSRLSSREDAEDVACEVVHSLPTRTTRPDLKPYMIGIARRKIVDRLRRSRDIVEILEIDHVHRFDDASDDAAVVERVLSAVAEDQREALVLKYVIGLSSAEIGTVLNRRSDAVDSLLQRGRAAFAAAWTEISSEKVNS
jgi:RNA polymerase sigma factor (sigma-70 family)